MSATPRRVADLFCGVGPFALRLAERARVSRPMTTMRGDRGARVRPRKDAGPEAGRRPRRATCSAARSLPEELKRFDAVVFDPPRQGAEAQARELAASEGAAGGRGVVQCRDLRARRAHPGRRRLSADRGHAGRPVPLFGACGDRGAVCALMGPWTHFDPWRRSLRYTPATAIEGEAEDFSGTSRNRRD